MFETSSNKAYSTFLFELNKKNEFYNRASDDYKKVKRIISNASINTIEESIAKDLEQFDGFKYERGKIIIDSLMKNEIMNF